MDWIWLVTLVLIVMFAKIITDQLKSRISTLQVHFEYMNSNYRNQQRDISTLQTQVNKALSTMQIRVQSNFTTLKNSLEKKMSTLQDHVERISSTSHAQQETKISTPHDPSDTNLLRLHFQMESQISTLQNEMDNLRTDLQAKVESIQFTSQNETGTIVANLQTQLDAISCTTQSHLGKIDNRSSNLEAQLETIRSSTLDQVETQLSSFENKLDNKSSVLKDQINTKHSTSLDHLENKMSALDRTLETTTELMEGLTDAESVVAFTAIVSPDLTALTRHQVVKFEKVVTNIKEAYNSNTGFFRCPISGLYHFSVTITSFPNKPVTTALCVTGLGHRMITYSDGTTYNSGSASMVVHIKTGAIVYVRNIDSSDVSIRSEYSSFSGHLIRKM